MKVQLFRAKSLGDAGSRNLACEALIEVLQTDPRVERVYQDWRRLSGVDVLLEQRRHLSDSGLAENMLLFCTCIDLSGVVLYRVWLPALVNELGLALPWLEPGLLAAFYIRISKEAGISLQGRTFLFHPPQPVRGRRAKGGGDSIRRNIAWFYRAEVQQPREKISTLAKAWAAEHVDGQRRSRGWSPETDPRKQVEKGIARAKALLDYQAPPRRLK